MKPVATPSVEDNALLFFGAALRMIAHNKMDPNVNMPLPRMLFLETNCLACPHMQLQNKKIKLSNL